ncbi:Crp/Fnr family transcriptional regulator [Flexivirga alba]|uniref:Crp/Fnr family transcriptional regulator n=1 Tax=Flexivirga alba TaxID=702742 RepID=A0ABW2ABT4_9MICO
MDTEAVRKAPLFAALDDDAAEALLSTMTRTKIARGQELFHEGEQGDSLYVITGGKVKLGRRSADGRENLLAILGEGEMLGELSLFDPGPRTATASAIADTELVGLSHPDMTAYLGTRPEIAMTMLSALAARLRRTNEALGDLVFTDVPGRVAKALLDLSRRFGQPSSEGTLVAHDLTQEELAQLVGASRETVNKALADFSSRGWIKLEARAVTLMDAERLQRRAR